MDIMDMTLRQILHGITLTKFLEACSAILVLESIVRSVAVNKGYKNVADWCDRIADIITFVIDVFKAVGKQSPKTTPVIILCFGLIFATGCASAVLKSGCGHINGAEVTIPYVGGKANGNAYGCYMGCVGMSCKAPDYAALARITAEYIKDASKDNAMTVSGPGTIIYTPTTK